MDLNPERDPFVLVLLWLEHFITRQDQWGIMILADLSSIRWFIYAATPHSGPLGWHAYHPSDTNFMIELNQDFEPLVLDVPWPGLAVLFWRGVSPIPSWPKSFNPQHIGASPAINAQEWYPPRARDIGAIEHIFLLVRKLKSWKCMTEPRLCC